MLSKFACCCSIDATKPNVNITETPEIKKLEQKPKLHLICDDASSNRTALKRYLNLFGCQVEETENGLEAVEKIKNGHTYNIIWADIHMPKLNGFDAAKEIRKLNYEYPIIALTGYVDEDTIKKCYAAGMNHVVPKPFNKQIIQMYCEKY